MTNYNQHSMEENFNSFYENPDRVEEYIKMTEGYNGTSLYNELRKHLPRQSTLLELGMGPGTDLDVLAKDYAVTGSDYSMVFIDKYRLKQPNADLMQLDAVYVNTDRKFDAIYSNKVLHHLTLTQLEKSLLHQSERLNTNGIVFHTFWRGDDEEEIQGMLFRYYQKDELIDVFEMNYTILDCQIYTEMEKDDSILIIARVAD